MPKEQIDRNVNANPHRIQKSIHLSQGTIRYSEYGEGKPIVFIHGLMVNGKLWRKVIPHISDKFRCIVPDLPLGSHELALDANADVSPPGLSKLIADFLAALDLKSVTLVGNDTGGALCQIVVTKYPERIERLILTNCDAFENFLPPMFNFLQWGAHIPGFIFFMVQALRFNFFHRLPFTYGWLSKRPIDSDIVRDYSRPLRKDKKIRRDMARVLTSILPQYTIEAAKKLKNFKSPVLLVWATEDKFFPYEHAVKLNNHFPNARIQKVSDSFAFIPEDQPEYLAKLITDFMKK